MFTETFKSINEQTIQRKIKVFSNQIQNLFLVMSNNHIGYQEALLDLNIKKRIDNNVSHQAINKKSSSTCGSLRAENFHLFIYPWYLIIQKFFNGKTSKRIFAVDGSQANLSCSVKNNGFRHLAAPARKGAKPSGRTRL